jgi:9-cis-epoxycarotenoid dioxygenase
MLHDFLITEKFVIIPDMPLCFDPKSGLEEQNLLIKFKPEEMARFGVMPRESTDPKSVVWFEFPKGFYVFHFVNSWDWINDKGEQMITIFGAPFYEVDINIQEQEWNYD